MYDQNEVNHQQVLDDLTVLSQISGNIRPEIRLHATSHVEYDPNVYANMGNVHLGSQMETESNHNWHNWVDHLDGKNDTHRSMEGWIASTHRIDFDDRSDVGRVEKLTW